VGASRTAQEALERAVAAGKLAEGKFVYETALSEATALAFKFEGDELSASAKKVLDDFAARLKSENRSVFIEIQGHTDNTGGSAFNLRLGEERAEAVRRYLNMKGGVALHRMSVISYGENAPVASNKTRAGREQNRRVVLVVLK
jgi:outer membrane protein OmpA-like peptidoglycan-associated protein